MPMSLKLAIQGNLVRYMEQERQAIAAGIKGGIDQTSRTLQLEVRGAVAGRFNRRIGNTVRRKLYQDRPFDAAALVYSKFGRKAQGGKFLDYLAPHVFGAVLKPSKSQFLYVPFNRRRSARTRAFRNLREAGQRSGKNTVVLPTRRSGVFVIVRRTRTRTTIIAFLVRQVRIRPSLDFQAALRRADQGLGEAIVRRIEAHVAQQGPGFAGRFADFTAASRR